MAKQKPLRPCRLDDELYLKARVIADGENRTFNNYVENLIKIAVSNYEREHGEIKVDTDSLYQ